MKLATLRGARDGTLLIVSRDLRRAVKAQGIAETLLDALERWDEAAPRLAQRYEELNDGLAAGAFPFDATACAAPLPRSPQWCDGSAFLNHGRLMERAFNTPPIPEFDTVPVMYQGASDDFLGPTDDVALPDERDGIDFEGEFGVVVGAVPMGVSGRDALAHVRLLVQINDWSLRGYGPREMKTGFGFLQAKPSTSFAPVAVTPDELGGNWQGGRVNLRLLVEWNEQWFGHPSGAEMNFDFGTLIAHAARTRRLSAGTVIGSGTVSNADRAAGSACIAERRVIEIIDAGAASTPFMRFGDRVRMTALDERGNLPFGTIDQRVVPAVARRTGSGS
ncbi:fumarylacetoacetate hydrolase family protein [Trinickia caryophylli]|uniref:Fumarylacetoacetate (FAA) hydrolase n=1 Tax=Trinickia caryophylli TaxID=28094 RepID=A0A1X7FPC0_TRICW|nr:fumarylacetoacetate hydrolase family protein [Trinickia caryophylli]PMS09539.1 FAA hydrolase family protein [Trinickia caryophylli]TRX14422.1 fumarylacetoacetate hydrolase family protein [Trinickia caryophylli]WQE14259.1 fumarylacetoacetate hydrolase family protein [Trinickia caryophylli]SMF56158.1 fumarylacetoacetate (FAA) hydrolase [Trinickia caryophylli]GLU33230.1 2-keto-4-pentenoate hydratase [Trinickia caryophylli]